MSGITVPEPSLVVLIGPSGSGKSTFAARHFLPTEVVSSDRARGLLADDENDQRATAAAFDLLHLIASKRLELGRVTVIDATNVRPESRSPLVTIARERAVSAVAIVLDLPETVVLERSRARSDRRVSSYLIRRQRAALSRSMHLLGAEGFDVVVVLRSEEQVDSAVVVRSPSMAGGNVDVGEGTGSEPI